MAGFEGVDRRQSEYSNIQHPFIFKPGFTLGTILAIILSGIGGVTYVATIDKNHAVLVQRVDGIEKVVEKQEQNVAKELKKINEKIDRILNKIYK